MECKDIDLIKYVESEDVDPSEAKHIQACPQCRKNIKEFSRLSEILTSYYASGLEPESLGQDPRTYEPLPDNLRKVLRRKSVESKTRKAIEALAQKSAKSKQWVEDMVRSALRSPDPMDAPAARDDLTKTSDEPDEKKQTRSESDAERGGQNHNRKK